MMLAGGRFLELKLTGASHAADVGFILKNFPPGLLLDFAALKAFLERRSPGRDQFSSARREPDNLELVSGVSSDGFTDGSPIVGRIRNLDARPEDYGEERSVPRPGHADFPQWVEFGRLCAGGGENSGRLTAPLTAAGAICLQFLARRGIRLHAEIESVHGKREGFEEEIALARERGDSVGGTIRCEVTGLPVGYGGPFFGSAQSAIALSVFAIPGVKGVEFGSGFKAADAFGSENDDEFYVEDGVVKTRTDNHGGVLGGRFSGMPLTFRLALKPTPTIAKKLKSVDLRTMKSATLESHGRHDPCIVPRALPVVEAVAAFAIADLILEREARTSRIVLTLTERTLEECVRAFERVRYFVDLVELRADYLERGELERVAEFPAMVPVQSILTYRAPADGGVGEATDEERRDFYRRVISAEATRRFAYVDFEAGFADEALDRMALDRGINIIRSRHYQEQVMKLSDRLAELHTHPAIIPKVAFKPCSATDAARCFKLSAMKTRYPFVLLAMGRFGRPTRLLAAKVRSVFTYAGLGELQALGQFTPEEMVRTYRFRDQSARENLYAITGYPIDHTKSPLLHNGVFFAEHVPALMIPLPSQWANKSLSVMRLLKMKGAAVTMPLKREIMDFLDMVDPVARKVGAVNTVRLEGDMYVGYNTDIEGFEQALDEFVDLNRLAGLRIAILGNGGAAQAIKYVLGKYGAKYTVFRRRHLGQGYELIINATPVDPIADYVFRGDEYVFDLNYEPSVTPLLSRAQAAGCKTTNGLRMLEVQAEAQRRLWKETR